MYPLLSFFVSAIGLAIGTYTDLRSRIISDGLNHSLLVIGLLASAYYSFSVGSAAPFITTGFVVVFTCALACVFWRLGAWAGGDVKLFTALASLNPYNPFVLGPLFGLSFRWGGIEYVHASTFPVFMFALFVVSVVMLIPYSALLALSALRKKALRKGFFDATFSSFSRALGASLVVSSGTVLLGALGFPLWWLFFLLLAVSFVPPFLQKGIAASGFLVIVLGLFSLDSFIGVFVPFVVLSLFFSWYGFARVHVLTFSKRISDLVDGDIVGERIVVEHGKPSRSDPLSWKLLMRSAKQRDLPAILSFLSPSLSDVVADPSRAAGVSDEDISRLRSFVKQGLLEDSIKVKASAPFVPAVFLAYILLNLVGDGALTGWFG